MIISGVLIGGEWAHLLTYTSDLNSNLVISGLKMSKDVCFFPFWLLDFMGFFLDSYNWVQMFFFFFFEVLRGALFGWFYVVLCAPLWLFCQKGWNDIWVLLVCGFACGWTGKLLLIWAPALKKLRFLLSLSKTFIWYECEAGFKHRFEWKIHQWRVLNLKAKNREVESFE